MFSFTMNIAITVLLQELEKKTYFVIKKLSLFDIISSFLKNIRDDNFASLSTLRRAKK